MRLLQEFMHNNAREPEDEDHENIQDKLFSLPGSTMTEIWELCVLSSRSANGPTNIQLAKNIAASIQDSLQNAVKKHPLSRIDAVPSREKAKAALAARKRKYQADKAFQEMDEVFQPLKAEMALYEQGKRRTSNTGTKSVLESFEKRLKEAAKKAEQLGKRRQCLFTCRIISERRHPISCRTMTISEPVTLISRASIAGRMQWKSIAAKQGLLGEAGKRNEA